MPPRTPLVAPRSYFEQRGFDTRRVTVAFAIAAAVVIAAFLGFGMTLSRRLRGNGYTEAADAVWGALLRHAAGLTVALLAGWLVVAVLAYLLSRAAVSHDGTFEQTVVVAGWAAVPSVVSSLVAFAVLVTAVGDASMTFPQTLPDELRAELARTSFLRTAAGFLVAAWQTHVYGSGLAVAFDDDGGMTWLVGGLLGFGGWLLTVL